jgi:type IV secretion system protein TrbL
MKRKSMVIAAALFLLLSLPAFSWSLEDIIQGDYKLMDVPLISGIDYFRSAMGDFMAYAMIFAFGLGLITIGWTSFRLWAGTMEVRKAVVDVFCKFIIYIALLNAYPRITDYVMNLATKIGLTAGNGFNTINTTFNAFAEDCEKKVKLGQRQLKEFFDSGAQVTNNPKLLEDIAHVSFVSPEEQAQFLNSLSSNSRVLVDAQKHYSDLSLRGIYSIYENPNISSSVAQFNQKMNEERKKKYGKNPDGSVSAEEFHDAVITLQAIREIFVETTAKDEEGYPVYDEYDNLVRQYVLSPFMLDAAGNQTDLLSPGAMIKLSVIVAHVLSYRLDHRFDEATNSYADVRWFEIDKKISLTLTEIQQFLLALLMTLAIILTMCFFVIQYCMCIFEYAIVTSVGAIFIPFCLFDGTKHFTAKLVTLFSSYFLKLSVMIFCLFWAMSTFIQADVTIMTDSNPTSLLNVAYFIFTTLLCWVVTQNGPKIAVALINGNPDLSMGEFLQAAGTAAAGAVLARKAAHTGAQVLQGAGHAAQGGVRAMQTQAARWSGAGGAIEQMERETPGFKRKPGQQLSAFGALTWQALKERAGEIVTGNQSKLDGEEGRPSIGSVGRGHADKFGNKNGTQTFNNAKEASERAAKATLQKKLGSNDDAGKPGDEPASTSQDEKRV